MLLEQKLKEDMKEAMKAREAGKKRLSVIRMALSAAKNKEIELKQSLSDDDMVEVLSKEVKQRRDSIEEYRRAEREDIVRELEDEIEVLKPYLPQQLTEIEIEQLVRKTVAEIGACGKKDMGKVMGTLMPRIKGRADGKMVKKIVSALLQ